MHIDKVIEKIEEIAPLTLQEEWDNSGWQVKVWNRELDNVLVALELNDEVIDEALNVGAHLIVTHHPFIFEPIKSIDHQTVIGKRLQWLLNYHISVYSTHTPFDKCNGGNNDYIGDLMGIKGISVAKDDMAGFLRVGMLENETTSREFIDKVSNALDIEKSLMYFTGDLDKKIKKVAWCTGGAGDIEFQKIALKEGCDIYVTSDIKHHEAWFSKDNNLMLLDALHYGTEKCFVENMANFLEKNTDLKVIRSKANYNPFTVIE